MTPSERDDRDFRRAMAVLFVSEVLLAVWFALTLIQGLAG